MDIVENKFISKFNVPSSACDYTGGLGFVGTFNLFMDLATEHAASLGIGSDNLRSKNCFWVAAKTRIRILRQPRMMEEVTASTWPEKPKTIRFNRYYTIEGKSGVIAEGKTEWAILDMESGRPCKAADVYPQSIEHLEDTVCSEPFARINTDFADCKELCKHRIVSADIDLSQHMNNVAYIRAVLSAFTCDELREMNIKEIEIAYRHQCYEGEVLSIRRRDTEDSVEIGIIKPDGNCGAVLSIR